MAPRTRPEEPEELVARVNSFRQSYFISRSAGRTGTYVDDEAILEVTATIASIAKRHKKRVGDEISLSLIHAVRYKGETHDRSPFFGTVNLRGAECSALAYLPAKPFWQLPTLIERGADRIELRFSPLHSGCGELLSFFLGNEEELVGAVDE